jgi:hypothetical protein
MRNIIVGALLTAPKRGLSRSTPLDAKVTMFGRHRAGFTLIEALLSSVITVVCAMAVSAAFYGGFQNLRDEGRTLELVNHAAGKMDQLIATSFADLQSGSDSVTFKGETVPRQWSVSLYDVDGDTAPEADAKRIVVTVGKIELSTLVIDSAGLVTCKR